MYPETTLNICIPVTGEFVAGQLSWTIRRRTICRGQFVVGQFVVDSSSRTTCRKNNDDINAIGDLLYTS